MGELLAPVAKQVGPSAGSHSGGPWILCLSAPSQLQPGEGAVSEVRSSALLGGEQQGGLWI